MQKKRLSSLRKALQLTKPIGFSPSKEDVQAWYRCINRHVFDGILAECPRVQIFYLNKGQGSHRRSKDYDHYWANTVMELCTNGEYVYWLEINRRYPSIKYFLDILAHEMIHLYQIQYESPEKHKWKFPKKWGHGQSFEKWRPKFEKIGLAFASHFPYVYEINEPR